MLYKEVNQCRSCHSKKLTTVLNLGELYISDFILPGEEEVKAPLELVYCEDCSLVQLRHTVDRDHLYRDQYWYKSGLNESMVSALKDVVEDAMHRVELKPDDYVLDIGCNDGTMLSLYPPYVNKHGFDPAFQFMEEARKKAGAIIFADYFPSKDWMLFDEYKVITSIAQFYNMDDVNEYVRAIRRALHKEGVWIVQMQDLASMIKSNGFDNICHEHVTYWGGDDFLALLDRHGLKSLGETYNNVNGRSVRIYIGHGDREKAEKKYSSIPAIKRFAANVESIKARTMYLLQGLKAEGKTVYGVAASTKFNTLAQYYGITPDLMPAIAERSPEKVGRMTVGTHIPIISEEELRERKPDYLFCCAWGFADNFIERYKDMGAKWIIPLPEIRIVEAESCQSTTDKESGSALAVST